jgi:monofunctional biosynthetic peptidoglycan transglycosylase
MTHTRFRRRLISCLLWALAAWIVITFGVVTSLRWATPPTTVVMLLEPGALREVDYRWVDRTRISKSAALAVIASEDQKFLSHAGFDVDSLLDAVAVWRDGGRLRGASTITQQVAKNLFLWNGRSFLRKGIEAYFAVLLELCWPKERILEVYLNTAEFGTGVFGIEAAATRLLGLEAGGLELGEAALLAAVLPNPKRLRVDRPSAYVRARQSEIVHQVRLLDRRGHYRSLQW